MISVFSSSVIGKRVALATFRINGSRHAATLMKFHHFIRRLHCKGCGSHFQTKTQDVPGFKQQFIPKPGNSFRSRQSQRFDEIYSQLSPEQQQAIECAPPILEISSSSTAKVTSLEKQRRKQEKFDKLCRYCVDNSEGRLKPLIVPSFDTKTVPRDSRVFFVVDAHDFPMSLDQSILDSFDHPNIVVNRADLVVSHVNQISRLKDYILEQSLQGFSASRLFITSATKGWGLPQLSQALAKDNWFIGKTNTGKTSLVQALSEQDEISWPVPFTTQEAQKYEISANKALWDTPSLPEAGNDGKGIFSLIDPKHLRAVSAGKKHLSKKNQYNIKSAVAKPGQTVSVAGLVGLELPKVAASGNSVHTWALYGGAGSQTTRAVNNVDKISELCESSHPIHQGWTLTHNSEPLERVCSTDISPGSDTTVVVRGLGPVNIRSFGKFSEPFIANVWAKPGVEVGTRTWTLPWLAKRRSTRQKEVHQKNQEPTTLM